MEQQYVKINYVKIKEYDTASEAVFHTVVQYVSQFLLSFYLIWSGLIKINTGMQKKKQNHANLVQTGLVFSPFDVELDIWVLVLVVQCKLSR